MNLKKYFYCIILVLSVGCSKEEDNSGIEIKYIQLGNPSQNGYIERFNRTYREDVLDAHLFRDIEEVNLETERFREEYNRFHPHKSLGRSSPLEYFEEFS
ncbi:MAG: transposase [Bacteroidota bacterium]